MKMKVKVLFDADVPRPLRDELPRHTVKTMQEMGWGRMKDKEVLMTRAAQEGFEVFVTKDKNIKYQINPTKCGVLIYELNVPGSETRRSFEYLKSQMPILREFLYELEFERRHERQQEIEEREEPTPETPPQKERPQEQQHQKAKKQSRDFGMEL